MTKASPVTRSLDRPAQSQLLLRNTVMNSGRGRETPAATNVILNASFDFHRRKDRPK
jgi:hypothetical protein